MSDLPRWAARQYGRRILFLPAAGALIGVSLAVLWALLLFGVVTSWRPDLARPSEFGSDTSNYAAAGERLVAGGDLYALRPGDRPVPADNPPDWSVPILSPPSTATPWAVLTLVPDPLRFSVPWAAGLITTAFFGFALAVRTPLALLLGLPMVVGLAVTAWSGNVNALIPAGAIGAWIAGTRNVARSTSVAAGVLVGGLAAMKIGPVLLLVWLVARRRWWATLGATATALAFTLVPLVGDAGSFVTYAAIAQTSSREPAPLSLGGLAIAIGFDRALAALLPPIALGVTAVLTLILRNRPVLAFAAVSAGVVFALPVVRHETLGLILIGAVPLAFPSTGVRPRPSAHRAVVLAALAAVVGAGGIINATALGAWDRSTLVIESEAATPVVVRLRTSGQPATFGYRVLPGEIGVAWSDRTGQANGALFVFDPTCRFLSFLQLNGRESRVTIGTDGSAAQRVIEPSPATDATHLLYVPDCAFETRWR